MYKTLAIVTFCIIGLFQSQAFSSDITPGLAKTKDIVRLSLWYEGIRLEQHNSQPITERKQIRVSPELNAALMREQK